MLLTEAPWVADINRSPALRPHQGPASTVGAGATSRPRVVESGHIKARSSDADNSAQTNVTSRTELGPKVTNPGDVQASPAPKQDRAQISHQTNEAGCETSDEAHSVEGLGEVSTPEEFALKAAALAHPLRARAQIDADLQEVVRINKTTSRDDVRSHRKKVLDAIRVIKTSLRKDRAGKENKSPDGPLLRHLLTREGYDDADAASLLEKGAPLLGVMGGPAAWAPQTQERPPLPRARIVAQNEAERSAFLATVRPGKHDRTLWKASMADRELGRMRGPFDSPDQVRASLRKARFALSRRFGVQQTDKVRPCDDFSRAYVNDGVSVDRKLHLSTIDSFFALAYAMADEPGEAGRRPGLHFWRRDHEGAYRQVPIEEDDQPLTVVVFCHPDTGKHVYFYHTALPFGATASVYGYNRLSRAIVFLARRLLWIPVDSYFDDFWGIDKEAAAEASFKAFGDLNEILGFTIKEAKDVPPAENGTLLGVAVRLAAFPFRAEITAERKLSLRSSLKEHLDSNRLAPGEAATLAGRMNFAVSAMFGRVGRAPLKAVYARQHSRRTNHEGESHEHPHILTRSLRASLEALARLVEAPPPRILPIPGKIAPVVSIFSDGEGKYGYIGGVLLVAAAFVPVLVFEAQIPPHVYDLLVRRHNQIALIELLAALTALSAFSPFIKGKDLRFFIDNRVAECAVRNGYVRRDTRDACALVSELWFQLQRAQATVWVDRVPSKLNIADGPSRPDQPELSAPLTRLNREVRYLHDITVPDWAVSALERSLAGVDSALARR